MKYNKNLAGVQITDEIINRSSSASARLAHDTMIASTVVVRTAAGGGGALLSLTTDYTLGSEDTRLTTEAGGTVYTTLAVVNGAYHSTPLYVSYKTVGDYAEAEDVIQESGYVSGRGWYVKYGDGTMEQWGNYTTPSVPAGTEAFYAVSLPTSYYSAPVALAPGLIPVAGSAGGGTLASAFGSGTTSISLFVKSHETVAQAYTFMWSTYGRWKA